MTDGYQSLRGRMERDPLPPWHERLPLAFWRGSTTGSKEIDLNTLELNRRYQLCRLSHCWPIVSMPASTELFNAAMQQPTNK